MPLHPNNKFVILAAAAWALAELILGLTVGGFLEAGRAEAVAFLTLRPFLLLFGALLVMRWPWRQRALFYLLALVAAGLGEALLVLGMGAVDPWTGMLRALGASLLLLAPVDLGLQAILRWLPGAWTRTFVIALFFGGLIALTPRAPWDAVLMAPGDGEPAGFKPRLLLMTSLPIVWGDYGAFDPRSRPSQTYRALQEEFEVQPIDSIDPKSLAAGNLLLLAQPRWLSPSELVALDEWVRRGGRAVILADPDLRWPSDLPLGDVRRPLPSSLLGPLLAHWQLVLEPPRRSDVVIWLPDNRKVVLDSPGRFKGTGGKRPIGTSTLAYRTVGKGRAILVADADLMRDDLWVAPGRGGDGRHRRLADNPLYLADLLDEAAGIDRPRVRATVSWGARGGPQLVRGLQLAILPTLLLFALAILLALRGRFRPHIYPQGYKG